MIHLDSTIALNLSSLEEKVMQKIIPRGKFNNPFRKEHRELYDPKNDKSIVTKCADKGSAVVVWDRMEQQLVDENVYEKSQMILPLFWKLQI